MCGTAVRPRGSGSWSRPHRQCRAAPPAALRTARRGGEPREWSGRLPRSGRPFVTAAAGGEPEARRSPMQERRARRIAVGDRRSSSPFMHRTRHYELYCRVQSGRPHHTPRGSASLSVKRSRQQISASWWSKTIFGGKTALGGTASFSALGAHRHAAALSCSPGSARLAAPCMLRFLQGDTKPCMVQGDDAAVEATGAM